MRRQVAALALACGMVAPAALCAQDEVPFVVTPDNVTLAMLELAQVGPQDFVLDLGSGDGRIVILAARRFGARGLGVEISPELVQRSRDSAARAGVAGRAAFLEQDLFKTDLSRATVITLYLLQEVNLQLRPALLALEPGTRIVSHDWDMGDWWPDRSVTVDAPDKSVGREKRSRLHLWVVPARLHGRWCGNAALQGTTLQVQQHYQTALAVLTERGAAQGAAARIDGPRLRMDGGLSAVLDGKLLRFEPVPGPGGTLATGAFERCPG